MILRFQCSTGTLGGGGGGVDTILCLHALNLNDNINRYKELEEIRNNKTSSGKEQRFD